MVSNDYHQLGLVREGVITTLWPEGDRVRTTVTKARASIAVAAGDGCLTGPVAFCHLQHSRGGDGVGCCSPTLWFLLASPHLQLEGKIVLWMLSIKVVLLGVQRWVSEVPRTGGVWGMCTDHARRAGASGQQPTTPLNCDLPSLKSSPSSLLAFWWYFYLLLLLWEIAVS